MKPAILFALILTVSSCYGKGRHGEGGPDGPDGPPPGNWTGAANCTVPLTLLQAAPDTYATFLKLLNETNATRAYGHPSRFNVTRAPSEAFFAAWFAATGTTQLPDIASYNKTQLHQLRRALLDLMQPLEFFLPRNDTGHNETRPGGPGGPGGKGPNGQLEPPPMGSSRKLLRGGPGGPGSEQGQQQQGGGEPEGQGPCWGWAKPW